MSNWIERLEAYTERQHERIERMKEEAMPLPVLVMVESWFWRLRSFCQRLANRGTKG